MIKQGTQATQLIQNGFSLVMIVMHGSLDIIFQPGYSRNQEIELKSAFQDK
jgi:hypothetical protein